MRNLINIQITLLSEKKLVDLKSEELFKLKQLGFSDVQIAWATNSNQFEVRNLRNSFSIKPSFKTVDTCAAEFSSNTPYHYSTYERIIRRITSDRNIENLDIQNEVTRDKRKKVLILGKKVFIVIETR